MEVTYLWPPWLTGSYHPRSTPDGMAAGRQTETEALDREKQIGGLGGSLEPPGPLLDPLGLSLRTSKPFTWRILSAFLRA
jgi:hypothetical protein